MNKYYDIIVAGGGPAGMAAAWSAAKGGAKTLLVEKNSFLGGTGTAGGVSMYINWKGDINGQLTDLSGHFYRKLMKALDQCGGRYPMGDNLETNCDFVDIEDVKRLSEAILVEAGVKLLYDTQLSDVKVVDEVVRSVFLTGKNLDLQVECRTLIDCTGDADACRMAELTSFYHWQALPLTIFNGWQWEYTYSMCQYESVSYDLANRGGSWENGWEAILNLSCGTIQLQQLNIKSLEKFSVNKNTPAQSVIEVKTFSSMRTRDGYPKERKL